jgi:hypothetical protein
MKNETLKHLTKVARQLNEKKAFEHFAKMIESMTDFVSLQEILIAKYGIDAISLDYLFKGSDEQCSENALLLAIRCDELRCNLQ